MPRISLENVKKISMEAGAIVLDPIPKDQYQRGPNCGFYALSVVLEYWKEKGKISETLPARKRDIRDGPKQVNVPKDANPKSLRAIGKQVGALDVREKLGDTEEKKCAS